MNANLKASRAREIMSNSRPSRALGNRRTPSNGHFCGQCHEALIGRNKRFCSDRCRMKALRSNEVLSFYQLLTLIEVAAANLRAEWKSYCDEA